MLLAPSPPPPPAATPTLRRAAPRHHALHIAHSALVPLRPRRLCHARCQPAPAPAPPHLSQSAAASWATRRGHPPTAQGLVPRWGSPSGALFPFLGGGERGSNCQVGPCGARLPQCQACTHACTHNTVGIGQTCVRAGQVMLKCTPQQVASQVEEEEKAVCGLSPPACSPRMDNVRCNGDEATLLGCLATSGAEWRDHQGWPDYRSHSDDAGVRCTNGTLRYRTAHISFTCCHAFFPARHLGTPSGHPLRAAVPVVRASRHAALHIHVRAVSACRGGDQPCSSHSTYPPLPSAAPGWPGAVCDQKVPTRVSTTYQLMQMICAISCICM